MTDGCKSCARYADPDSLAPRDLIVSSDNWRVVHSFNSSLPGWLVVVPNRHVEAIHELTDDEAQELGPLLIKLSRALRTIVGCEKTYVIQFAESDGWKHVHFHVVPRMASFTKEERAKNVFTWLGRPENEWVPTEEMDRIALAVRTELGA